MSISAQNDLVLNNFWPERESDFVVYAFIGKFFVAQDKINTEHTNNIFLTYNSALDRFFFTLPNCTFQKPLYDTLLVIVIVVLICNLFLQSWSANETPQHSLIQDDTENGIDLITIQNKPEKQSQHAHSEVKLRLSAFQRPL